MDALSVERAHRVRAAPGRGDGRRDTGGSICVGWSLDMTNFVSSVDSRKPAQTPSPSVATPNRVGSTVRLVGLGLVVTADGGVPICSHAYAGNRPDVTQFGVVIEELAAASAPSPTTARASPWSLRRRHGLRRQSTGHRSNRTALRRLDWSHPTTPTCSPCPPTADHVINEDRFPGVTGSKRERTCSVPSVVSWSPTPKPSTTPSPAASPRPSPRATRRLAGLAETSRPRRRKPDEPDAVEADIAETAGPAGCERPAPSPSPAPTPPNSASPGASTPPRERHLEAEIFGKRVLFTDHDHWPVAEVIAAYRSQADDRSRLSAR